MKVLVRVYSIEGEKIVKYTVLEKYEDSVLAIPYGYADLLKECEEKPTLFHNSQIIGFEN